VRHLFRLLVLVDQPGDHLDQPGVGDLVQGTHTKLLDQDHFIALRVVRQNAHRVMAHEQLTADFPTHSTGEQLMAKVELVEPIKALEALVPLDDLDRLGH